MNTSVRTKIVKVGNSQGIRIPKLLLEQSGIRTDVEIEVHSDHLVVRNASAARSGWDEAFAIMAQNNDDTLIDGDLPTHWDQTEWEW